MESNMHHDSVFHHHNHGMGEPNMNHGQHVYGGGMVQYETLPQQQGMFHDALPPQQHYHPPPPPNSPGSHRPPPPVMVSRNSFSGMWAENLSVTQMSNYKLSGLSASVEFQYHKISVK
jgi:hypothetical protein